MLKHDVVRLRTSADNGSTFGSSCGPSDPSRHCGSIFCGLDGAAP